MKVYLDQRMLQRFVKLFAVVCRSAVVVALSILMYSVKVKYFVLFFLIYNLYFSAYF